MRGRRAGRSDATSAWPARTYEQRRCCALELPSSKAGLPGRRSAARPDSRRQVPNGPDRADPDVGKLHPLKEPKERVRELTEDEEARLFGALNERAHDVVFFAIRMGLRLSECVNLTWEKIAGGGPLVRVFGKGEKEAPVRMQKDGRHRLW